MAQGLGFSVPLDTIKSVVARIAQKRSSVPTGISLGVGGMRVELDATAQRTLGKSQQFGMEVLEIRPQSSADQAELKRQDIIVTADEEPITEPRDLQKVVRRHKAGERMIISFLRGGKLRKVTVVL